jgi:hypothetical protein
VDSISDTAAEFSGVVVVVEEAVDVSPDAASSEVPAASERVESTGLMIRTCEFKRAPLLSIRLAVMENILPEELPTSRKVIVAMTPDPDSGLVVITAMRIVPALAVLESMSAPDARLPLVTVGLARVALSYDICRSIPATDDSSAPRIS